ncbi:unnamed protein product [Rhizophagus irregularis]|uniref:Uncharacterized protein n=1 Tax=Rhizophagus irregularis TaxID=588596 RepID=A0A915ZBR1_9GLOM|nr:unnamed protein product [Rhizophagus irregularis]
MPHPRAHRSEDRIADGGRDHRRRRLAQADGDVLAFDKANVEFGHIGHAQRHIGVEIGVLDQAIDEFGAFMQRHAEAPQSGPLRLCERAIGIDDRPGIGDQSQLLDAHHAGPAINMDARDAGDPGRHVTFLPEAGGDAERGIGRQFLAPARAGCGAAYHFGLAQRPANGVGGRPGIATGPGQQFQAEGYRIAFHLQRGFIDEAFHRPIGPARPDRAQPARAEGGVGKIIGDGMDGLVADLIPMVRARNGEGIIGPAALGLGEEGRRVHLRRPTRSGVMLHRDHRIVLVEAHPHALHRGRAYRIEQRIVLPRQHHLDRAAQRLGGERGGDGIIAIEPPPKAATQHIGAQDDLGFGHAERLGECRQNQALPLVAGMDFEAAVLLEGERVEWFQLEMQHGAGGVDALQRAGGVGGLCPRVDDVERDAAIGLACQVGGMGLQVLFRRGRARPGGPGDLEQIGGADRGGVILRDHHHPAGHRVRRVLDDEVAQIAAHRLGLAVIDRHDLGAEARWRQFGPGIDHVGHLGVDAV